MGLGLKQFANKYRSSTSRIAEKPFYLAHISASDDKNIAEPDSESDMNEDQLLQNDESTQKRDDDQLRKRVSILQPAYVQSLAWTLQPHCLPAAGRPLLRQPERAWRSAAHRQIEQGAKHRIHAHHERE